MTTLLVHMQLGRENAKLLQVAADLALRLDAEAIGVAACQPLQITYGDGYVPGDLVEQDRNEIEKEINEAESEFRAVLQKDGKSLGWRSAVTFMPLADYLADQARCADLVITGIDHNKSVFDSSRHVDTGNLVMQLGRPALIVPTSVERISLKRILIGWKDTRESRRAVLDALPLLKRADHVVVCEIASEDTMAAAQSHLKDVAGWLKRNGVAVESIAGPSTGDDAARLHAIAIDQAVDVIVAGAYGHSRLREWALGGVTRDLLMRSDRCCFVSH